MHGQTYLSALTSSHLCSYPGCGWKLELSSDWDVLGPFPIHAREQHTLIPGPSFPLNLSEPIDYKKSWPSSYADGGQIFWGKSMAKENGDLNVCFPQVRWASLRATEGWAALQHHAILRTTLTVSPPDGGSGPLTTIPPQIKIHLKQGSYFTLMPTDASQKANSTPVWHLGDIYAMTHVLPKTIDFPTVPSMKESTRYDLFVSGDYEIRLFGDPTSYDSDAPIQTLSVVATLECPIPSVIYEPSQDVIPNFIEGFEFGSAFGIGLRSSYGWWRVKSIAPSGHLKDNFSIDFRGPAHLAPTQMRVIPFKLLHSKKYLGTTLDLTVSLSSMYTSTAETIKLEVSLSIEHIPMWNSMHYVSIRGTYFFGKTTPTAFVVTPPKHENEQKLTPRAVVLALHGAGVDNLKSKFWSDAIPRQDHSWIVMPTGRTPWGLDWHGPSAMDSWQSVDALAFILNEREEFHRWKTCANAPVVVVGHSNGGQGTWYFASRYPDRVLAVVPTAAYIKSQLYVSWAHSRSSHYVDPILQAILNTALTPDDNDLFLSNVVDIPILAIHGGDDDNVPVWHSREATSIVKTWRTDADITFIQVPNATHWFDTILDNEDVQMFLDKVLSKSNRPSNFPARSNSFTLTVSIPRESGAMHGWSIDKLKVPGRLGRLNIRLEENTVYVTSSNVMSFKVLSQEFTFATIVVDGFAINVYQNERHKFVSFTADENGKWSQTHVSPSLDSPGRVQSILSSQGSITIVIPHHSIASELTAALRLAHDLQSYHRIDAQIIESHQIYNRSYNNGNIIVIGKPTTPLVIQILSEKRTSFEVKGSSITLNSRELPRKGLGTMFTHPPVAEMSASSTVIMMISSDSDGLERLLRLFPIRTGIAIPDWVISQETGLFGAGVWGPGWTWNQRMSWLA